MEAPDKIYIREYPDGIAHFWEKKKKEDVVATIPHEYIRKDALLEIIKEESKFWDDGEMIFGSLVDKINSM